jgi:hypothetical protein
MYIKLLFTNKRSLIAGVFTFCSIPVAVETHALAQLVTLLTGVRESPVWVSTMELTAVLGIWSFSSVPEGEFWDVTF